MSITILAAHAPGIGHCNTILPLVEELAAQPDWEVYLCGSQTVARFAGTHPLTVHHRSAGCESHLRTRPANDVIRQLGRRMSRNFRPHRRDPPRPALRYPCERGGLLAACDRGVPFLRVVACADAATPTDLDNDQRLIVRDNDPDPGAGHD